MRTTTTSDKRTVVAISGKHAVTLAMKWPKEELSELIGFAIYRSGSDTGMWLQSVLRFEGESVTKGRLYDSIDAPIQSMIWSDYGLSEDKTETGLTPGADYTYEVIPVRGVPGKLKPHDSEAVTVEIRTEPLHENGVDEPEVHFNRGLSAAQEYERLFGQDHQPTSDPEAMKWLARNLDTTIVDFINQAVTDTSLRLDVAAYHLDHEGVIDALCMVGDRVRISLDWGAEERDPRTPGPNGPAYDRLKAAGAEVHQRRHVNISHNKYVVVKAEDGSPKAVLTGSTNFTDGGISTQSNQSIIVHNPRVAEAYVVDFERVLNDDNVGLREHNRTGATIDGTAEVYFSPHSSADRPDLDRFAEIANQASSSRLFMTFRMTDNSLIESMLDTSVPSFGLADRVYRGSRTSGDRLLFDAAHATKPRVVACNAPLDKEPDEDALFKELKRDGYEPLIHHKILLFDWDKPTCTVVTGSANYSTNSTKNNDENSLVIHGDQRLAEEYFVEFCRLFTHWHPRWLSGRHGHQHPEQLAADASWTREWHHSEPMGELLAVAIGEPVTTPAALSTLQKTTR